MEKEGFVRGRVLSGRGVSLMQRPIEIPSSSVDGNVTIFLRRIDITCPYENN
jgi:hypothetical protein